MKINHKQQELIDNFLTVVKNKFPNIEYKNLDYNPDDPEHILINVTGQMDDEHEIEFIEFESELEADIHLNYGYRISMMFENTNFIYA